MHGRLTIALLLLISSGCSGPCPWLRLPHVCCYNRTLDDALACKVARDVAREHLARRCAHARWPSQDYQAGYAQAYQDVALGSDGNTPLLPPEPYWNSCARTETGHCRADDWFAGYADGAPIALSCRGTFNRVHTGDSSQTCP